MDILYVSGLNLHTEVLSAAAICGKELVESLSLLPDVNVNTIAENIFNDEKGCSRRHDISYLVRRILKWPCSDPDAEDRCYAELAGELTRKKYDAMVVGHFPYETVSASIRYKKEHPDVKLFLYAMDPIVQEPLIHWRFSHRCLSFLTKRAEKNAFRCFNYIFHMQCNYSRYHSKEFNRFQEKFGYIDFPLIRNIKNAESQPVVYENQTINVFYTGKLYQNFRSPKYLTEALQIAAETVDFKMSFYSKGDCEDYLKELSKRDSRFSACGYIPKVELDAVMEDADVYVNIGNKYSSMLPSKLLYCFEQGKPVIHVSNQPEDACLPYMKRYPLGLVIYESDPIEASAARVSEFLRKTYRQRVSSEEICSIFYKNTPEWSAKEIVKEIQGDIKD